MKQRYYIATVIQRTDEIGEVYWASVLKDLINAQAGEGYLERHQDARHFSLCLVWAEDATHITIAAHPDIIIASPLFDDDADRLVKMDNIANIDAVKPRLEAIGLNSEWMTGVETYRDVLRYVVKHYWLCQVVHASSVHGDENAGGMVQFLLANLTTQVKDIPVQQRTRAQIWMQNRGLATGWITGTTTIRQVLHFILMTMNIPTIRALRDEF